MLFRSHHAQELVGTDASCTWSFLVPHHCPTDINGETLSQLPQESVAIYWGESYSGHYWLGQQFNARSRHDHRVAKAHVHSRKYVMDHVAMYVRQSKVSARITVGKSLVVQTKCMQHGCVQVMDAGRIFRSPKSKLISGSVNCAAFDTATGEPNAETVVVVISPEL